MTWFSSKVTSAASVAATRSCWAWVTPREADKCVFGLLATRNRSRTGSIERGLQAALSDTGPGGGNGKHS